MTVTPTMVSSARLVAAEPIIDVTDPLRKFALVTPYVVRITPIIRRAEEVPLYVVLVGDVNLVMQAETAQHGDVAVAADELELALIKVYVTMSFLKAVQAQDPCVFLVGITMVKKKKKAVAAGRHGGSGSDPGNYHYEDDSGKGGTFQPDGEPNTNDP